MIPKASITAWRKIAPWGEDWQVEQDLVLSRALVDMFSRPAIAEQAAFRGGTALHKLFFDPPGRYSEDIDLVQRDAGPSGRSSTRSATPSTPGSASPSGRLARGVSPSTTASRPRWRRSFRLE